MNVTMLIPKLEPENKVIVGGSASSLIRLANGLRKRGDVRASIVVSTPSTTLSDLPGLLSDFDDQCIFSNDARPQSAWFGLVYLLKSVAMALTGRFRRADIVHGHSGYGVYALCTYLIGLVTRSVMVHSLYCPLVKDGKVGNKAPLVLKGNVSNYFLKKMDMLIAMSGNVARSLREAGVPEEKISVIATAIDTERFNPDIDGTTIRRRLQIPASVPVILYVGNVMRSKGLLVLLEAFRGALKEFPDSRLVVTLELKHAKFDEHYRVYRAKAEELGVLENIVELGIIDYMPGLMAASDVVVAPYLDTQGPSDYPIALMEAMSAGRCVVGTMVGGMPRLIEDNITGLLVPPNDVGRLENALVDLLSSPEKRKAIGKAARISIHSNHSIERSANEHASLYRKLLLEG